MRNSDVPGNASVSSDAEAHVGLVKSQYEYGFNSSCNEKKY